MDSENALPRPHIFYAGLLVCLTLWMSLFGIADLPVIDRDEARYVQATVQMVETDDYLNIRFQDEARNKKPAGIYWMQAVPVNLFSEPGERVLWAHRLPSVLGTILAVLATYWAGVIMLGRRGAVIAGAILATSALMVFEAHIAKTDAILCGLSALTLAAMLHLRVQPNRLASFLFWTALGGAVMIKGPITPAIIVLTLISLGVWERDFTWIRRLISIPGIVIAVLMILPWSILIWMETNGAFFRDAIGGDLAPKLAGGQEKHGAPPGYYLGTLPILFWPGSIVLISGFVFAWRSVREKSQAQSRMSFSVRLLLCWIVPFWLVLELVPTKLPNYLLPTYPALALLCACAVIALLSIKTFPVSRRIGAVLFAFISITLLGGVLAAEAYYGTQSFLSLGTGLVVLGLAFASAYCLWSARMRPAGIFALLATMILTPLVYQHILPRSDRLAVSYGVEDAIQTNGTDLPRQGGPRILSPHFTEPSLVYRLGTSIILGDKINGVAENDPKLTDLIILDQNQPNFAALLEGLRMAYAAENLCPVQKAEVKGTNYSKGDEVELRIYQAEICGNEIAIAP